MTTTTRLAGSAILDDVIDTAPDVYLQRAREHPYSVARPPSEPAALVTGELAGEIRALGMGPDDVGARAPGSVRRGLRDRHGGQISQSWQPQARQMAA